MADLKADGKLDQLKGRIQSVWGDLTDDDVDRAEGDRQQLVGTIKEKTGDAIESIEQKLDDLFNNGDETKSS